MAVQIDKKNGPRWAATAAWISIALNAVLFGFKFLVGKQTGSMAIIADSWHTLSDSITSMIVIVGLAYARKPADQKHPFGHGRTELIATMVVAIILAFVAFGFIKEGIGKIISREAAHFNVWAIVVSAVTVVVKEGAAQFSLIAAKKSGSRSLKADAWHHRSDAITSLVILVGIIFGKRFWWVDAVLGIAVALLILVTAYELFREAANPLLGEAIPDELVQKIQTIANKSLPKEHFIHHYHLHAYGDHRELSFHVKLDPEMHLKKAHDMCDCVEKNIREELNLESTIHIEPLNSKFQEIEKKD